MCIRDSTYDEGALYENGDGTYSDGSGLYVRVDGEYIPVTADASVSGWYTDEEGTNYVAGADAVKAVFASAEDGENITFIDDVSISSIGTDTYITAERVTIDLNDHNAAVPCHRKRIPIGAIIDRNEMCIRDRGR